MSKTKKNTTPEAIPTDEFVLSLTQQQTQVALLWEAKSENEIAAALDITPEVLAQWKNLPIFLAEIADLRSGIEASPRRKTGRRTRLCQYLLCPNRSHSRLERRHPNGVGTGGRLLDKRQLL